MGESDLGTSLNDLGVKYTGHILCFVTFSLRHSWIVAQETLSEYFSVESHQIADSQSRKFPKVRTRLWRNIVFSLGSIVIVPDKPYILSPSFPKHHCDLFHAPASPMCLFKLEQSQLLLHCCNHLQPCSVFVTALLSHLVWSITRNNLYDLSQCSVEWIFLYYLVGVCWL